MLSGFTSFLSVNFSSHSINYEAVAALLVAAVILKGHSTDFTHVAVDKKVCRLYLQSTAVTGGGGVMCLGGVNRRQVSLTQPLSVFLSVTLNSKICLHLAFTLNISEQPTAERIKRSKALLMNHFSVFAHVSVYCFILKGKGQRHVDWYKRKCVMFQRCCF